MSDSATAAAITEQTGIRSYYEYTQSRTVKSELGKDDFLALLSAQLQYQDPLEPQTDTAFIAQLAQFSSLSYLQTLTESTTAYQYFNLAGKYVYADVTLDTGKSIPVYGVVDRVIMQNGKSFAQVGEYLIDCSKISQVLDKDLFTGNSALLDNANLIGKYLKAYVPAEDGGSEVVSGKCTRVSITDGVLVAYLESGVKVGLADIFDVSDSATSADSGSSENPGSADNTDDTAGVI